MMKTAQLEIHSFHGKTAIVTGGCSGIGYAIVEHLLKGGIQNIAILDLSDIKNVTQSLRGSYKSQNVIFIESDVTKKEQMRNAFEQVVSQFNFIDFVVANAGVLSEKDYELTVNVNVLGVLHTTYTAIDFMSKTNGGRGGIVLSLASVAGLDGYFAMPSYSATKHAVVGLNRCFSNEFYFTKHGIKFITICPSFTDTPLLDDIGNSVTEGTRDAILQIKGSRPVQTADSVGRCVSETLASGKNGSVWILQDGKQREITLNNYLSPSP